MTDNSRVIHDFYEAFAAADHPTMAASYSEDATFSDPVFPTLHAPEVRDMWRMFCTSGNPIEVSHGDVRADELTGSARWEAIYRFPKTGRLVHNIIFASFEFDDGSIVKHRDTFDFYRWSRMALGAPGLLLGWTPFMKKMVRAQAAAQLRRFRSAGG